MISVDAVQQRHKLEARSRGYRLHPDPEFLNPLLEGLRANEERYGYPSCPCRLASGVFDLDRDIICPCDYRDPDVVEYGTCYCCFYVDEAAYERGSADPIPERRPQEKQMRALMADEDEEGQEAVPGESAGVTRRTSRPRGRRSTRRPKRFAWPPSRSSRAVFAYQCSLSASSEL